MNRTKTNMKSKKDMDFFFFFLQNCVVPSSPVSFADLAVLTLSTSHDKCVIHFTDSIITNEPLSDSKFSWFDSFDSLIHDSEQRFKILLLPQCWYSAGTAHQS